MMNSPAFASYVEEKLKPLRIELESTGCIVALSGDAACYGLETIAVGDNGVQALPFLLGLDEATVTELPMMAMPSGRRANIVITPAVDGHEILLVDTTLEWQQQRDMQQKANELHLLSEQLRCLVRKLEETRDELRASRDEAQQASRLESEFIARMSHEFRTPLTSIIGHARRLPASGGGEQAAGSIERGATHLLNLVENLLDEAQLRSGRILNQARSTALGELLQKLREHFRPLALDKSLDFSVHVDGAIPARVMLDDMRLRQVLINLVGNAVKYTETGCLSVTAAWGEGDLEVRIEDQGPGISAAAQERIFSAFWRESSAAAGAGLGLSISRSLVELMAGSIDHSSTPGVGTIVTIRLPAPAVAVVPAPVAHAFEILLAEDSFDVAELLTLSLSEAGYPITHCASGRETLRHCRESGPALVIVDRDLDDMDGFEITRRLRADGFVRPVVMLTASNLVDDRDRARSAGCNDFLVKSAGISPLLESVNRLAGRHDD